VSCRQYTTSHTKFKELFHSITLTLFNHTLIKLLARSARGKV